MAEQVANGPGRIGKALGVVLPIVREGGPITLLLVLILAGVSLYFLNSQFTRQQEQTRELVHLLLAEKDARLADSIKCMSGRGS